MGNPLVKIIGFTTTDEKVCAAGGRISTQEGTALQIWEKSQDKEKNENLIFKVREPKAVFLRFLLYRLCRIRP